MAGVQEMRLQQPSTTQLRAFPFDMLTAVGSQTAAPREMSQNVKPIGVVGILRRKTGSHDLRSNVRATPDQQAQDIVGEATNAQDACRKSLKRMSTFENLRQSVADFEIGPKLKQMVGRKRSRDEHEDENEDDPLEPLLEKPKPEPEERKTKVRKISNEVNKVSDGARKLSSSVRTKCQAFRKRRTGPASLQTAPIEQSQQHLHPLHWNPPGVNPETLAILEGTPLPSDSAERMAADLDGVMRFLNEALSPPTMPVFNLVPDISWAGAEVDDFRLFVNAADDETWLQDVEMI